MEALANHLWQSTLFTILVAAVCYAIRNNSARVRHWLWLAASMKFLIPFSLLVTIGSHVEVPRATPVVQAFTAEQITMSFAPVPPIQSNASEPWWPVALASLWLLGSIAVLIRWFRRWLIIRRVLQASTPLSIAAPVPVYSSHSTIEPGVFGIFRPVMLLPEGITAKLSAEELDSVIAHELAHVARRDNLTAAVHMLVEALFWFHPLVWWIGARLIDERERACDEEVLRLGKPPQVYAEGILNVCKFYLETPLPCASGVTGADLKRRIGEIMTNRITQRLSLTRKLVLVASGLIAVTVPVFVGILKAQSLTFEVASIRPSDPNIGGMRFENTPNGGLRATGVTLRTLIEFAYDVQSFQVSGGPGWLASERFDVSAKPENANASDTGQKTGDSDQRTQAERLRERTRALLSERFHVVVRRESAERPVYALVQAKGGHKLKPASAAAGTGIHRNRGLIECDVVGVGMFSRVLSMTVGRPVIDRSGIEGKFNFRLEWAEDFSGKGSPAEADLSGTSIFAAIQQQLGLKLESTKGPVDIIAIERAEKPTAN